MTAIFHKAAAERASDSVGRQLLCQTSLSHLARAATEARTQGIKDWISSHAGGSRRYWPPKGSGIRPSLQKERKEVTGRYFQLLSGHELIGSYLERTRTISSSAFWWRGSGRQQSRHHLFVQFRARPPGNESCGGASGRPAGGSIHERKPSRCSSRTSERPRRS